MYVNTTLTHLPLQQDRRYLAKCRFHHPLRQTADWRVWNEAICKSAVILYSREEVLGPDDAVDWGSGCVADGAHGISLGWRLGSALIALSVALRQYSQGW